MCLLVLFSALFGILYYAHAIDTLKAGGGLEWRLTIPATCREPVTETTTACNIAVSSASGKQSAMSSPLPTLPRRRFRSPTDVAAKMQPREKPPQCAAQVDAKVLLQ